MGLSYTRLSFRLPGWRTVWQPYTLRHVLVSRLSKTTCNDLQMWAFFCHIVPFEMYHVLEHNCKRGLFVDIFSPFQKKRVGRTLQSSKHCTRRVSICRPANVLQILTKRSPTNCLGILTPSITKGLFQRGVEKLFLITNQLISNDCDSILTILWNKQALQLKALSFTNQMTQIYLRTAFHSHIRDATFLWSAVASGRWVIPS